GADRAGRGPASPRWVGGPEVSRHAETDLAIPCIFLLRIDPGDDHCACRLQASSAVGCVTARLAASAVDDPAVLTRWRSTFSRHAIGSLMTSSVHEHYEHLLADYYTRMFGDFDSKVAEQQALLEQLGIGRRRGGRAVDLGCGSGFQSLALARLGYRVLA